MVKLIIESRGGVIHSIYKSMLDEEVQVFVLDYATLDAGTPPASVLHPLPITDVILPDITTLLVKKLRDYQPKRSKGNGANSH